MVLRNSICNLSKYSIKNDEILTPVLNETRISDIKCIFSNPMGYRSHSSIGTLDMPKNILRSKSFNGYTHFVPRTESRYISSSYRRASSLCITRNLGASISLKKGLLPSKEEKALSGSKLSMSTIANLENSEKSKSHDAEVFKGLSDKLNEYDGIKDVFNVNNNVYEEVKRIIKEESLINDAKFENERLSIKGISTLDGADGVMSQELIKEGGEKGSYFTSRSLLERDEVANESMIYKSTNRHNSMENKELSGSGSESRMNKKERVSNGSIWNKLTLGAFTPLVFGLDATESLSALTIKGRQKTSLSDLSERSEPELSKSKVFLKLVEKIEKLVKVKREKVSELHKNYGSKTLGTVTLSMLFSGLKDVPAMVTETSELDPTKGIRFRGLTVDEMLRQLPGKNEDCPYTESVLWYLLTGDVPDQQDVKDLSEELYKRSSIPSHVFEVMESMPPDSHPLTQYVTAVSALQTESVFRRAYLEKTYQKDTCWKLALEDCLNLVAKNVVLVGYIYRRSFIDQNVKREEVKYNSQLDYAANLAHFLGDNTELFSDLMRLYLALHSDHEGGNVSAHASHLVGSALADPYFCLSSALCGLSGPLHGMANQECLVWIKRMLRKLGPDTEITVERVKQYAQDTMAAGQVIPGYGHAVLKVTDPRHTAFVRFARTHFPNDPMVRLLDICLEAIPQVLTASGKVRNPNPNVDCSTGVLLSHFNIDQPQVFTVFFGLSRSLGILSQLVWARALRYPIERPKSLTLDTVEKMCKSPDDLNSSRS